jgi:hypothetical protein
MRYPRFNPNPSLLTNEARIFSAGGSVETARAPLPIGTEDDVYALPGPVSPETWTALGYAVSIIHRIVPWTTVIAAPVLVMEERDDGYPNINRVLRMDRKSNSYVPFNGLSFGKEEIIALSLHSRPSFLIEVAYHEAWHQIEKILDEKILDEIDRTLIPLSWGSKYEDTMIERRARCFANWCTYYEEGMPPRRIMSRIDEIFDAAAVGDIGREWQRQQKSKKRAFKGKW